MESVSLQNIADLFLNPIIEHGYFPNLLALSIDHALTSTLCFVAYKAFKNRKVDPSAFIGTGILAGGYVASSINFYFFNFLATDGFGDYSLYLGYTFLDSLTVLCIIFAHAYYRLRFSFSSNVACYMVLTCSYLQFYTCILLLSYKYYLIEDYDTLLSFGAIYSILVQVVTWTAALILVAPIKSQALFASASQFLKRLIKSPLARSATNRIIKIINFKADKTA